MYEEFYGLRERPFEVAPDPRFLYLSPTHREALIALRYGLTARKGGILLIGEAGTGKTTLIRAALESMGPPLHRSVHVTDAKLTPSEFFELLTSGFGLRRRALSSKADFLLELKEGIVQRRGSNGVTALAIDEAQDLADELLEEVRVLADIEAAGERLLPVVLAGQPKLAARLDRPGLRQLKQRVALRCRIDALDIQETAAYIASRVRVAGGEATEILTRDAVVAIFEQSNGVPRVINEICESVLLAGLEQRVRPVTRRVVLEALRRRDLGSREVEAERAAAAGSRVPSPRAAAAALPSAGAAPQAVAPKADDVPMTVFPPAPAEEPGMPAPPAPSVTAPQPIDATRGVAGPVPVEQRTEGEDEDPLLFDIPPERSVLDWLRRRRKKEAGS